MSTIRALLASRKGGPLILDAGMGTGLGRLGLSEKQCWTAGYRTDDAQVREAVLAVHRGFLRAGCDVLTANTYNVSKVNAQSVLGLGTAEAAAHEERCIKASIDLARSAIATHAHETGRAFEGVLFASLGCFGTTILGRGETANRLHSDDEQALRVPGYGVPQATLEDFHRTRAASAIAAGVRSLAFETVPDLHEARAIAAVLAELQPTTPGLEALVMFTCRDAEHVDNGDRFDACCEALAQCEPVVAVGLNCTEPRLVPALLAAAERAAPGKLLIAKPNSGEAYDMRERAAVTLPTSKVVTNWQPAAGGAISAAEFGDMARHWHAACGAALVGGCCRVGHEEIAAIAAACAECDPPSDADPPAPPGAPAGQVHTCGPVSDAERAAGSCF